MSRSVNNGMSAYLVLNAYPKVLRRVILRYLQKLATTEGEPGSVVGSFLHRNMATIFRSTIGELKKDLFFPRNGESDIEKWDFHMLVWVILNLCPDLDDDVRAAVQRLHNLSAEFIRNVHTNSEQEQMKKDIHLCLEFIQDVDMQRKIAKEVYDVESGLTNGTSSDRAHELHKWHNDAKEVKDRFKDPRGKFDRRSVTSD